MQSTQTLTLGGQTKRSQIAQFTRNVEWNGLPDNAQEFIVRYGLKQYLADAHAGATEQSDAEAKVDARIAKLISGDLTRTRGDTDKPDTETGRALKNAKAAIRKALKDANKTADKETIANAAKAAVEKNPKWLADARKQLEAERKASEDTDLDDILSDILGGDEPDLEDDEEEDGDMDEVDPQ